jgi:O-antigen ligase
MPVESTGSTPSPVAGRRAASAFIPSVNPFSTLLMIFAVLLLINHLGRPFDFVLVGLKIPAITCGLGIGVAALGAFRAFRSNVGKWLAALTIWMVLIIPLSFWRLDSLSYMESWVGLWVVLFMILACAPKNFNQLKLLAMVVGAASMFYIAANILVNRMDDATRFQMGIGTFGNSDDSAILAEFAIPFWLLLCSRMPKPLGVPLGIGGMLFLLRVVILTATRSSMIALPCMFLIWLWRARMAYRIAGIAVCSIAALGLWVTAPQSARSRLATTLEAISTSTTYRGAGEATDSAAQRHEVLMDGIAATLRSPIWGVGAGQFAQYRRKSLSESETQRKTTLKTHNTYLQMAAENGIPGLLLYLLFVGSTYRTIMKVRKATMSKATRELALGYNLSGYLEMAFVLFVVEALFVTMEEHVYMFILGGMAVAAERLSQAALARAPAVENPPPVDPAWAPGVRGRLSAGRA